MLQVTTPQSNKRTHTHTSETPTQMLWQKVRSALGLPPAHPTKRLRSTTISSALALSGVLFRMWSRAKCAEHSNQRIGELQPERKSAHSRTNTIRTICVFNITPVANGYDFERDASLAHHVRSCSTKLCGFVGLSFVPHYYSHSVVRFDCVERAPRAHERNSLACSLSLDSTQLNEQPAHSYIRTRTPIHSKHSYIHTIQHNDRRRRSRTHTPISTHTQKQSYIVVSWSLSPSESESESQRAVGFEVERVRRNRSRRRRQSLSLSPTVAAEKYFGLPASSAISIISLCVAVVRVARPCLFVFRVRCARPFVFPNARRDFSSNEIRIEPVTFFVRIS